MEWCSTMEMVAGMVGVGMVAGVKGRGRGHGYCGRGTGCGGGDMQQEAGGYNGYGGGAFAAQGRGKLSYLYYNSFLAHRC